MPKSIYIDENGNEQILSSSPSALSGLLDTDITTPTANQVLAYDNNGKVVNVGIQAVTIQIDTTKATTVIADCWKLCRIVYLRIGSIVPNANYSGEERVVYDLPIGVGDDVRVILCDRNTGKSYRFVINSSGALVEWYNGSGNKVPSGADLFGSIMYFSAS